MTQTQHPEPIQNPIYDGLDASRNHPDVHGDHFFGVYARNVVEHNKFTNSENFKWVKDPAVALRQSPEKFLAVIEPEDLEILRNSILNQSIHLFNGPRIQAILNTPEAFVRVSKDEFAKVFLEGLQTPQGAALAAAASIAILAWPAHKRDGKPLSATLESEVSRAASMSFGLSSGNRASAAGFLVSSQQFRSGDFESNPLTADEIKAMPFLSKAFEQVFALAGQDHSSYANSVIKKLVDAGFPNAAAEASLRNNLEHKIERPARKQDLDDGPGF